MMLHAGEKKKSPQLLTMLENNCVVFGYDSFNLSFIKIHITHERYF